MSCGGEEGSRTWVVYVQFPLFLLLKNQTPKVVRAGSYFRNHLVQPLFERWGN